MTVVVVAARLYTRAFIVRNTGKDDAAMVLALVRLLQAIQSSPNELRY
jgi:hypothetical protein